MALHRWFLVLGMACGESRPAPKVAAIPALPGNAQPIAATSGDPPEPVAPQQECVIEASPVYCEPERPVFSARQPPPFVGCDRKLATASSALGTTGRLFSAAQTRRARATALDACCYLEWTWSTCD